MGGGVGQIGQIGPDRARSGQVGMGGGWEAEWARLSLA